MCVLHAHYAALDADNLIGSVAELEDIALKTLYGEILIDRADHHVLRLEQNLEVGIVGDRATGSDCREPTPAPPTQHTVDLVAMEQRAAPSAPRGEAVGKHTQHGSIDFALDIAVGPSVADESEELSLVPLLGVDLRRDLLGEHVERCVRHDQTVKLAAIGTINQRRTFHKVVVGEGKQTALWLPADTMARSAHALKESRNRARRAKLADEIHVANIDAKLEGGRCHHGGECTYLQPMLRVEPLLFGEAAMMRGDAHFAESV